MSQNYTFCTVYKKISPATRWVVNTSTITNTTCTPPPLLHCHIVTLCLYYTISVIPYHYVILPIYYTLTMLYNHSVTQALYYIVTIFHYQYRKLLLCYSVSILNGNCIQNSCTILALALDSEIMDRFWFPRYLNDYIDLPNTIESFASGVTASLVAKKWTKQIIPEL